MLDDVALTHSSESVGDGCRRIVRSPTAVVHRVCGMTADLVLLSRRKRFELLLGDHVLRVAEQVEGEILKTAYV